MITSRKPSSSWRWLLALLALTLFAAACGDDDDSSSSTSDSSSESASASASESDSASASDSESASASEMAEEDEASDSSSSSDMAEDEAAGDAFLTIEHKFGTTTLDAVPERVVSIGYNEHDFLLALGVVPVGLRDWYGDQPNSVWPWGQEALGDATPGQVATEDGLDYEAIAEMDPDVIVGIWSGMTQEEYDLLVEIAPVVAQPGEYLDYGTPWQEQTLILGQVTDRVAEAEAAVAEIDEKIAAVREAHPEWAELTAAATFLFEGNPGAYNSEDVRSRLLADFGFQIPEKFDEAAGDSFFFESSAETMPEDFDTDVVVWIAADDSEYPDLITALPTRVALPAYATGSELFASTEITGAFSHSSPLSLAFAIDALVAELEIATDGDLSTVVPSAQEFGTVAG